MSLTPGARLGVYEIVGLIGAGGMGEVYRARDARLNRDVAIKILPEAFAERRRAAGALRARSAGAGVAQPSTHRGDLWSRGAGAARGLVLELVEGPTLADRIAPGRFHSMTLCGLRGRSPKRSKRRTSKAWFTAI